MTGRQEINVEDKKKKEEAAAEKNYLLALVYLKNIQERHIIAEDAKRVAERVEGFQAIVEDYEKTHPNARDLLKRVKPCPSDFLGHGAPSKGSRCER